MGDEVKEAVTVSGRSYSQAAKLGAAISRWKQRAKASESKLSALEAKVSELEKRPTDAGVVEENKRLKAEAHARKHDDAFSKVARDLGVKAENVAHVRKLATYEAKGEPDEESIKAAVTLVLKDVPTFKGDSTTTETTTTTTPAKLPAGEGATKGAGGQGTDGPVVSRKQLKDPIWMTNPANAALAAKAVKAGSLRD